jgi:predicted nuclease of predicted toxin-antitoxin system
MKFKLDENIGYRGQDLLRQAGHDVSTIVEQKLISAPDTEVIAVCQQEQRCLVTLDLDFSNPLQFKPSRYSGIAVLRLPRQPSHADLLEAMQTLVNALEKMDIVGRLWIIQKGTVRIYQEESES